ncbi:MAG: hypothetical protein JSR46_08460, partial [Verrucomicrobia bacterium]|nr:hypothetical protein [Verrucomicrobiota bacterium]
VAEEVLTFLLYIIPTIDQIAFEDHEDFRFLIRELAFKNLQPVDQKIITGFCNTNGLDFDITFSTTKMQQPFAYCNGLIIGIPNSFNFPKEMVPYVAEEINPVQCITDQFIGLLNGPCFHDPQKRVEWILASWTKGRRLFSTPWQEEIVKTYREATFDPQDAHLPENQFVKMVETINLFLLMQRMGHIEESLHYFESFSRTLLEHKKAEEEPIYLILLSLFERFSDPLKGLMHLYQLSLYLLPLKMAGVARNGSFECLALQLQFKNCERTLYFSAPFDQEFEPLTQDEAACVETWLTHFTADRQLSLDQSLFTPFLQAPAPNSSPLNFLFTLEAPLFACEILSYERFFDVRPLAHILQAPLFALTRINTQFGLRGIIGFDLTERAIKAKETLPNIAIAFIQDAQRFCPVALRRAAPSLVEDIKALFAGPDADWLLAKWFSLTFPTDKEFAFALLRYSNFSEENKCTILKSLNKVVCTKMTKNNVPYYFLYRTECSLDDKLIEEDLFALSLFPLNSSIACFKSVLEVALRRPVKKELCEKIFFIFEKAVSEESTLWQRASELKTLP